MIIKTKEELEGLKASGRVVAITLQEMARELKPGVTTAYLDKIAGQVLASYGAVSAPKSEYDFPGITCISVNDEVAHGIPGPRELQPGDLVNLDVSASLNGFFTDHGMTFMIPPADKIGEKLLLASRRALKKAISVAIAGNKINNIGYVVETEAKAFGFTTIRNLCGHGVGKALHEEPSDIPNYYDPMDKRILKAGTVLAIETFVGEKEYFVEEEEDGGWLLKTPKRTRAAQFEHTVVVTDGKPIIVTQLDEKIK